MTEPSITLSHQPSHTPIVLRLYRDRRRLAQHQANAETARTWLVTTRSAVEQLVTSLDGVLRLLSEVSADAHLRPSLQVASDDVRQLLNSRVDDRPVFAGTAHGLLAYDHEGIWRGSAKPVAIQVTDDIQLVVGIDAPATFHYPPSPAGQRRRSILEFLHTAGTGGPINRDELATIVQSTRQRCAAQLPQLTSRLRRLDDLVDSLVESREALDRHWRATLDQGVDDITRHHSTLVSVDSVLLAGHRALEDMLETVIGHDHPTPRWRN